MYENTKCYHLFMPQFYINYLSKQVPEMNLLLKSDSTSKLIREIQIKNIENTLSTHIFIADDVFAF